MEKTKYIEWLEQQSLLYNAQQLAKQISGNKIQWQYAYAKPQPQAVAATASVWFNAYPAATITKEKQNILQFLGDENLWQAFKDIGIQAIHTGPMKLAGGIVEKEHTPTVDGWFDRIKLTIDPAFGSEEDYANMVKVAEQNGGIVVGDIVPGHTGKGADFLLALRNYKDYPGIYDLIEIDPEHWGLLPKIDSKWSSANLTPELVTKLYELGYIPGELQRVLFLDPGSSTPVTGWDATGEIKGVDGKIRRWVYLHYFKPGQPTMNWLDPSHAAERIISGDIIKSIHVLKNKMLRLDANPFLGIEKTQNSKTSWSEGHPLSVTSSNNIAQLIRKLGGWSFQELNLTLDAIAAFSEYGADLAYDFITRPAVQHAMLTGDTTFLRFMYGLMQQYNLTPNTLIHGMQNHDEITYELVHFLEHADDEFNYKEAKITGKDLRDKIVNEMHEKALTEKTPYNKLSGNGLCTTLTGLVATRLGITDIYNLTLEQQQQIQHGHLLLVLFNAMQPGIFEISGWDLVGALPISLDKLEHLLGDNDYRWLNRGAYDLLNYAPAKLASNDALPKAQSLYGSIPEQLLNPNSFVSQVKCILALRQKYKIHLAQQLKILEPQNPGVMIMLHKLPDELGYEITALNFGATDVTETVDVSELDLETNSVCELLTDIKEAEVDKDSIYLNLKPLQGKALLLK